MSKGDQTTTTQTAPNPQAAAAYAQIMQRAGQVAQEPWVPFTGEAVAPLTQEQLLGTNTINNYANAANNYYGLAGAAMADAGQPLTYDQIMNYYSPYAQNVVDKTQAQFDLMNKQALNNIKGNAASAGALGGDRTDVAKAAYYGATLPGQEQAIASLYDKAYTDAATRAYQQYQQNPIAFGLSMGQLGTGAQTAGLQGGQAQFAVGSAEQQTQQQQDYFNISQYLAKQGYDFQTAQWLAGLYTGVGSNMGGTGQTTGPAPNQFGQIAGSAIGTFGALAMMSDERVKEGISRIGKTNDGQPIYRFRYKGQPQWHIGLMAQDVEDKHPDAVFDGPIKMVDIKRATDDAVRAAGGAVDMGDAFSGFDAGGAADDSYVPGGLQITHGSGAPKPPSLPSQSGGDAGKSAVDAIRTVGALGKIGGYDVGGSPTATGSGVGTPFATSSLSYIPAMQIHAGPGAPPPPGLPKGASNDIAKNAADAARALSGAFKKKPGEDATPGATIASETPSADLPADMFGSNDANFGGLGGDAVSFNPYGFDAFAKKGGRINLPGGLALPGHNRIVMPMRAGMGMPSFVKGYETGGPPKDYSIGEIIPGSRTVEGDPDSAFDQFTPADVVPLPRPRPTGGLDVADVPEVITRGPQGGGLVSSAQPRALGFSPEPEPVTRPPADVPAADTTTDDYAARRVTARRPIAAARPSVGFEGTGLFGIPKDVAAAIMAGGFGMAAAAARPGASALGSFAEGAMGGLGTYGGIQAKRADVELESRKLDQQADLAAKRLAQESRKYTEMTAAEKMREAGMRIQQAQAEARAKREDERLELQRKREERADKNQQLLLDPTSGLDPKIRDAMVSGVHGKEFLDLLEPAERNFVEAAGNYEISPYSAMSKLKGSAERKMALIRQFNPDYDDQYYKTKGQVLKNFLASTAPQSPVVQSRAYNTAMGHAGELAEAFDVIRKTNPGIMQAAANSGTPVISYLAAQARQRSARGTPEGEAWNTVAAIAPLYVDETSKFYAGSSGSLEEKKTIGAPLNPNLSFPELIGALRAQSHMFKSKVEPLEAEYRDAMNAPGLKEYGTKKPAEYHVTRERAAKAYEKIEELYNDTRPKAAQKPGTTPTAPAPKKPTLEQFLSRATSLNPGASKEELTAYYNRTYQ